MPSGDDHPTLATGERPTDARYDVVVVGARAAGAATAHLLARLGLHVLLLDRSRYGADTVSTHALMRGGVVQLARWGVLDRIVAAGTPPIRRTTFRYDGTVVPVRVGASHGVDALYAPRRTVLDALLVDAAWAAGVETRYEVAVAALVHDEHGRVTGVTGLARTGGSFTVAARLVIGADGIRSTIAHLTGAAVERAGTGASTCAYGYWSGMELDGYEWNFHPRAASGVIPTNDGAAGVFVSAPVERFGRSGRSSFPALLAESEPELAARVAAAEPVGAIRTFRGRVGHVRRSWGSGWALVGDAGYFKDPLGAHGLSAALRDAELLARAAHAVVADGAHEQDALAAYQQQRDALSGDLFEVTDAIAGHAWTDAEIGPLLLRLNAAMADELTAITDLPALPASTTAAPAA